MSSYQSCIVLRLARGFGGRPVFPYADLHVQICICTFVFACADFNFGTTPLAGRMDRRWPSVTAEETMPRVTEARGDVEAQAAQQWTDPDPNVVRMCAHTHGESLATRSLRGISS